MSIIIVVADVAIVFFLFLHNLFNNFKKKTVSSSSKETSELSYICIAIAAVFLFCTLPYDIGRFAFGKAPFWDKVILILNSGMNRIFYFFRTEVSTYRQSKMKLGFSSNSDPKISIISQSTSIKGQKFLK